MTYSCLHFHDFLKKPHSFKQWLFFYYVELTFELMYKNKEGEVAISKVSSSLDCIFQTSGKPNFKLAFLHLLKYRFTDNSHFNV